MTKPIRVTKKFGRTLENLEMLWWFRDQAERRMAEHIAGKHMTADEWAAINTPDEAWEIKAEGYTPPPAKWREIKDEYFKEMEILAALAQTARRHVRIATGHEPIGKMVCRP